MQHDHRSLGWMLATVLAFAALVASGRAVAEEPPTPEAGAKPAEPPPLALHAAVRRGMVTVRGHRPASYASIALELRNVTDGPLQVDLTGSYLTPKGSKPCQRLGLGPVITPGERPPPRPGAVVVTLAPGGAWAARVGTVCLDARKSCPTDQEFGPAGDPLPPVREKVMRWWADHPDTSQSDVNSAIWRNAPEVTITSSGQRAQPATLRRLRELPKLRGTVHGTAVVLIRDGVLLARDPDGAERFLATNVLDAFPMEGALYAIARVGESRELWRHVETGDELWKRVAVLPDDLDLLTLEALPGAGLLATSPQAVLRLAPSESSFRTLLDLPENATHVSTLSMPRGRLRVGFTRPLKAGGYKGGEQEKSSGPNPELWLVHLDGSPPPERIKAYWNVESIAQGRGGTYALTNVGHLRELVGESFRDQHGPDGLEQILHVGAEHLWAATRDGGLVCVRLATGASVRAGVPLSNLAELRFDPVTGDAVVLDQGALVRIRVGTTEVSTLAPRPVAPPAAPPAEPGTATPPR